MRTPSPCAALRRVRPALFGVALAASGCAAVPRDTAPHGAAPARAGATAAPLPAGARPLAWLGETRLLALRTIDEAPPGGDGPSTVSMGIFHDGVVQPLSLPSPAIDAVPWGEAAAVRSVDGTLRRVTADGRAVLVARDVVDRPAVDDTGALLAVVVHDGALTVALHLLAGGRTHTIARDLPAAGALRFAPDARQLVYVGRSPGGVAGLHVVALPSPRAQDLNPSHPPQGAIPRCLTNCILTTGALDESAFLPLPAGPADLAFDGDVVRYGVVRVAYRGDAE